jgi:UDP-N-acetylglucosamine--N-acetylmuramyl-(pentapeptide) pyrophosphoryl-undecaprenol N-acetylglucosamine transferase
VKVIIAGGGTGGHLFPAVAVGEEILRRCPNAEVLFVGTTNGMEAKWFPQSPFRYELLPVRGFAGKTPMMRLRALREFLAALSRARNLVKVFGAELAVSAGGYASAPIAVAAILGRVPLVLLEQNTRPGLVNRLLWRFARKICVGFAEAAKAFAPAKVTVTGNPVRFSRLQPPPRYSGPIKILVLGGSTGAHRLNLGVLEAIRILSGTTLEFSVVHQTGEADAELVAENYRTLGCDAQVLPFIEDVADALGAAQLVIARAGAMTVSEIALAGRPAILVPYPFHRDQQQLHNGRVLERAGGAIIIQDDEHLGGNLARSLQALCSVRDRLQKMGERAHESAIHDASSRIVNLCFEVVQQARSAA